MKNILLFFIFGALILSCSTNKKENPAQAKMADRLVSNQPAQQIEPKEEITLRAYADGNKIYAIVQNNLKKDIKITPLDFAVIKSKELHVYNSVDDICEFPVGIIKPGIISSGWFIFGKLNDLIGERFVLNNPAYKPIYAVIEDYRNIEK